MDLKSFLKRNFVLPLRLWRQYQHDRRKFLNSSFMVRKNQTLDNLKASMTFHAHALEKGFVHDDFRPGFGKKASSELIQAMEQYLRHDYDTTDLRFRIATDTLNEYVRVHEHIGSQNPNNMRIKKWLIAHELLSTGPIVDGGFFLQSKMEVGHAITENFETFSNSRHSVRNFSGASISQDAINSALKLATNSPSVCNRQSYHVHQVHDKHSIDSLLKIQGGINGMAHGISDLLIVSTDEEYFGSINERNQPYIDGGIFSMNLLYSLHYKNIAACPLNADLDLKGEARVKNILNMKKSECLILFIAVGGFMEQNRIPLSRRETTDDILIRV